MTLIRTLLALLLLSAGAMAQPASRPTTSLNAADIERLTSLLSDEARRAEFLRTLEALAEASRRRWAPPGRDRCRPRHRCRPLHRSR